MKNAFFIQRAAIDVLLLNQASALEIGVYLVISKYTDKNGYYSGVGFKTIKERLGIGQKKAEEAIKRLKSMTDKNEGNEGQRLLYSIQEWLCIETGKFNTDDYMVGWVRGWFESEYNHQVWLSNDLVGCHGKEKSPIQYFTKCNRDNHARILLLMYKYCNRQYSGVNYRFLSKKAYSELEYSINDVIFNRSSFKGYHISKVIFDIFCMNISEKEINKILDEMHKSGFINISICTIGEYDEPSVNPKKKQTVSNIKTKTSEQIIGYKKHLAFEQLYNSLKDQLEGSRDSYKLAIKFHTQRDKNKSKPFSIRLIKWLKTTPKIEFKEKVFEPLEDYPEYNEVTQTKFIYRLDYKSINKKSMETTDCIANRIEKVVMSCGLEPASRKGKFYKSYWWFDPGIKAIALVGIIMPKFTLPSKLLAYSNIKPTLKALATADTLKAVKIDRPSEAAQIPINAELMQKQTERF